MFRKKRKGLYCKSTIPVKLDKSAIETLAAMYESTSNETRFYYVESSNEYLLGHQRGDLFYAGFVPGMGWVWHYSIDTPWGEERPGKPGFYYPSMPVEINFFTWLNGVSKQICTQSYEIVEEQQTELHQAVIDLSLESLDKEELINKILERIDISTMNLQEILYPEAHSNEKE